MIVNNICYLNSKPHFQYHDIFQVYYNKYNHKLLLESKGCDPIITLPPLNIRRNFIYFLNIKCYSDDNIWSFYYKNHPDDIHSSARRIDFSIKPSKNQYKYIKYLDDGSLLLLLPAGLCAQSFRLDPGSKIGIVILELINILEVRI